MTIANDTGALPPAIFDDEAFDRSLDEGDILGSCKQAITGATEFLHAEFRAGASAGDLIRLRAAFIDTLLGALWDRQGWGEAAFALVAVGGYGRGELHPHSDIDILLLLDDNDHGRETQLEGFLTLLWDIGLVIGHSVRTVAECARKAQADITILTSLMEARTIRPSLNEAKLEIENLICD